MIIKNIKDSNDSSTIIRSIHNKSSENSLHQLFYPVQPVINLQNVTSFQSLNLQSERSIKQDQQSDNNNYQVLQSSRLNQQQFKQYQKRDFSFCDSDTQQKKQDFLEIEQKYNLLQEFQNSKITGYFALVEMIFLSLELILIPLQYSLTLFREINIFLIIIQILSCLINLKLLKSSVIISFEYLSITAVVTLFMTIFFDNIYLSIINMSQIWFLQQNLWRQFYQYKLKENIEKSIKLIFQSIVLVNQLICYHYKICINQNQVTSFVQFQLSFEFVVRSLTFNTIENLDQFYTEEIFVLSVIRIFIILYIFISILKNYQSSDQLYQFFHKNKVSLRTKILILQYQQSNITNQENKLIFSEELIKLIKIDTIYPVLKLIFGEYSQQTIIKCISICELIQLKQKDLIIQESVEDDNSLYYFIEGEGSIQAMTGNIYHKFKAPYRVGELSFYTKNQRTASVVSESSCQVLKIKRQEFIDILTYYDKQLFHQTRDLIIFSKSLPIKCFFCLENTHVLKQCKELRNCEAIEESSKDQNRMYKSRRKRIRNTIYKGKNNVEQFQDKNYDSLSCMPAQMVSLDSQDSESNFTKTANFNFINIQSLKDYQSQELYSLSFDIDQQQSFARYFPQSNLDVIINKYNMCD